MANAPAFYHDWMSPTIGVRDFWDTVFKKALEKFWTHYQDQGPLKAAMIFHLGHQAVLSGQWDKAYGSRFTAAAGENDA